MTCYAEKTPAMSLATAKELAGEQPYPGAEDVMLDAATFSMCADFGPPCQCGAVSDTLCDWPMGGGKICDARLCAACGHNVGEDRDVCGLHFTLWRATPVLRSLP